jgi:hypothetical protein
MLCLVFDLLSVVCLLDPKVTWLHLVHMLVIFFHGCNILATTCMWIEYT